MSILKRPSQKAIQIFKLLFVDAATGSFRPLRIIGGLLALAGIALALMPLLLTSLPAWPGIFISVASLFVWIAEPFRDGDGGAPAPKRVPRVTLAPSEDLPVKGGVGVPDARIPLGLPTVDRETDGDSGDLRRNLADNPDEAPHSASDGSPCAAHSRRGRVE